MDGAMAEVCCLCVRVCLLACVGVEEARAARK